MFYEEQKVPISTPFIKLDSLLKLAGLCMSGGEAKTLIADGQVRHNGEICIQRGRKIMPGDTVECLGRRLVVASDAP